MTTIGPGTRVWCIKTSPWLMLGDSPGGVPEADRPRAGAIYTVEFVVHCDWLDDDFLKLVGIDGDPPPIWAAEYFRPIDDAPGETTETGKELENA